MGGSDVGESACCTQHPGPLSLHVKPCVHILQAGAEKRESKKKSNKNFNLGETPLLLPYQNKYVLAHGFCAFTGVVTPPGLPCMHVYSREYPSLDDISVRVSLLIVDFLSFQCLGRCLSNSIRLVYFNSKFSSFFPL